MRTSTLIRTAIATGCLLPLALGGCKFTCDADADDGGAVIETDVGARAPEHLDERLEHGVRRAGDEVAEGLHEAGDAVEHAAHDVADEAHPPG